MKVTKHVEKLLREGHKPRELIALGFPKQVVTRVRRRLKKERATGQTKMPEPWPQAGERLEGEANRLEALGFGKTELNTLRTKLEELAAVDGLTSDRLKAKFFEELAACGALLTFEKKKVELEGEVSRLEAHVESGQKTLKRVDKEEAQRRKVVESLQAEEAGIKATIHSLTEGMERVLGDCREKALTEVAEATKKMVDNLTEWGDARAELGAYMEDLKRARYFTRLPLSNEALEAFINDIGPLIIGQYLQISALWCSKNLNPKLRPPAWVTSKYYKVGEYTDLELADLVRWALEAFIQGIGEK